MPKVQGQYKGKDIYAGDDAYVAQQLKAIDAPAPISATALNAPAAPMQVQQYAPPPPPNPNAAVQQLQQQQLDFQKAQQAAAEKEVATQQAQQGTLLSNVESLLNQQGNQPARQGELEQQQGIPQLQQSLNNINAQINGIVGSAFNAQQNAEGRLAPTFAIVGEQAQIERQKSAQTFGLAAAASALQGNIALANDNVKRALDAEFGGIESRLRYQEVLLNINRDNLSDAQKKRADAIQGQIQTQKEQVALAMQERQAVYEVMTAAAQSGADNNVLNAIQNATTREAALGIASQAGLFKQEAETQVVKLDNGQTVLLNTQTGEVIKNIGGATRPAGTPGTVLDPATGQAYEYGTPEYVLARIGQTSGSKKFPVASEREQLGKFANVVALTDNLVGSLNKTTTDPVVGYLKSLNPYDFDARAVNAQVTALVPSVARALYGEVGVLTDTDIERYLKTLPNIRSTADQNKFIALMTLSNAKRAYEQALLNGASSGLNMSGFADSYKSLSGKITQLESELGTGFGGGSYVPYDSKETQDLEFSSTSTTQNKGLIGKAYQWGKSLFGF